MKRIYNLRFWATGGWFSYWAVGAAIVSVVATTVSTIQQHNIAGQEAAAASQAAQYNADLDIANAKQDAENAKANISTQRQKDASYLSTQRAALAASGVLSDTGSPMEVQATTAGRMEQNVQQYWTSEQESESTLYEAAQEGVYEGAEAADTYHLEGTAAIFSGIGTIANTTGQFSQTSAGQKVFGPS